MADQNPPPPRTPSKLKAGLKGLFSRKKKSKADTPADDTSPAGPSTDNAARGPPPVEMEGHAVSPPEGTAPQAPHAVKEPAGATTQATTSGGGAAIASEAAPLPAPFSPPPKAPQRATATTSAAPQDSTTAQNVTATTANIDEISTVESAARGI